MIWMEEWDGEGRREREKEKEMEGLSPWPFKTQGGVTGKAKLQGGGWREQEKKQRPSRSILAD